MPAELGTIGTVNVSNPDSAAEVIAKLADENNSRKTVDLVEDRVALLVLNPGQSTQVYDLEKYGETPARKAGRVGLGDADSFCTYVDRHSLERATTIWSSETNGTVTAVLDDHASHESEDVTGVAGWGEHRAVLQLEETANWTHWLEHDGDYLSQTDFAEHIEDGVDCILTPDAATMLEIAQSFRASSGAHFDSTKRLTGEVQFAYTEQTSATAGTGGTLEIPETFELSLAPFVGTDAYPVTARFRYRLHDGQIKLGYRLIRSDAIRKRAFDDTVALISTGTGFPVMAGSPRS